MVEMTISKVIVGVLLMLFVMSMIETMKTDRSAEQSLSQIYLVTDMLEPSNFTKLIDDYVKQQTQCFYLRVGDTVYKDEWATFEGQRGKENSFIFLPNDPEDSIEINYPGQWFDGQIEAWYDVKEDEDDQANANIITTGFVISLLLGWMYVFHRNSKKFANKIAVPLQIIGNDMRRVSQLTFKDEQTIDTNTLEIQKIQDEFFQMKNAIHSFAKYVPREIVLNMTLHRKMAKLGVIPREITIFFSDIAGFTTICEQLQPNEILKMLSGECWRGVEREEGGKGDRRGDACCPWSLLTPTPFVPPSFSPRVLHCHEQNHRRNGRNPLRIYRGRNFSNLERALRRKPARDRLHFCHPPDAE